MISADCMQLSKGFQFSTLDRDNDDFGDANCAVVQSGGWWYSACTWANLNGLYKQGGLYSGGYNGIFWNYWQGFDYSLKDVIMMVKPQ